MDKTIEQYIDEAILKLNALNNVLPCKENGIALNHLQEARKILDVRTADRERRQVKGKHIA